MLLNSGALFGLKNSLNRFVNSIIQFIVIIIIIIIIIIKSTNLIFYYELFTRLSDSVFERNFGTNDLEYGQGDIFDIFK